MTPPPPEPTTMQATPGRHEERGDGEDAPTVVENGSTTMQSSTASSLPNPVASSTTQEDDPSDDESDSSESDDATDPGDDDGDDGDDGSDGETGSESGDDDGGKMVASGDEGGADEETAPSSSLAQPAQRKKAKVRNVQATTTNQLAPRKTPSGGKAMKSTATKRPLSLIKRTAKPASRRRRRRNKTKKNKSDMLAVPMACFRRLVDKMSIDVRSHHNLKLKSGKYTLRWSPSALKRMRKLIYFQVSELIQNTRPLMVASKRKTLLPKDLITAAEERKKTCIYKVPN